VQQSGLDLARAVAYQNLVGVRATNANARADGMRRVTPFKADSSLLYHKLHWDADHHHARDYGAPMPLGGRSLSVGQIEFIRRWIEAGAKPTGDDVDTTLLADRTAPSSTFTPLAPPARGVQLRTDAFQVAPNFERELFLYRRVGNPAALFVDRIEIRMRPNSHHFILYTFDDARSPLCALRPPADQLRDIRNPDGSPNLPNMLAMACHVFLAGAQSPTSDYRFPAGVALRLPPNFQVDLNSRRSPARCSPTCTRSSRRRCATWPAR
jgi:hypothetical protein